MNPSNLQDEPSKQPPAADSGVSVEELQYHFEGLRGLFVLALIGLIVVTLSIDVFFIRKQMIAVRAQYDDQRQKFSKAVSDYRTTTEPQVKKFTASLETYATTHPDFQPILDKFRPVLLPYKSLTPSPATQAAPSTVPQATPK